MIPFRIHTSFIVLGEDSLQVEKWLEENVPNFIEKHVCVTPIDRVDIPPLNNEIEIEYDTINNITK